MKPSHRTAELHTLLEQRILVLDGAMGTMIQRERLDESQFRGGRFRDWPSDLRGNNDLLALTQPTLIRRIHEQYLAAGADIVETNTFNSTAISMADYGMESLVEELNFAAAQLAVESARAFQARDARPRFAAGVLGPTT
jgi:5-methyltetrahydrofolate--homocysteine methyltransferase